MICFLKVLLKVTFSIIASTAIGVDFWLLEEIFEVREIYRHGYDGNVTLKLDKS